MTRRPMCLLMLLAAQTLSVGAQQAPPPPRTTATSPTQVSAILVDVVVRDRKGEPVAGLTAERLRAHGGRRRPDAGLADADIQGFAFAPCGCFGATGFAFAGCPHAAGAARRIQGSCAGRLARRARGRFQGAGRAGSHRARVRPAHGRRPRARPYRVDEVPRYGAGRLAALHGRLRHRRHADAAAALHARCLADSRRHRPVRQALQLAVRLDRRGAAKQPVAGVETAINALNAAQAANSGGPGSTGAGLRRRRGPGGDGAVEQPDGADLRHARARPGRATPAPTR